LSAQRQRQKIDPNRSDVFAQIAGGYDEAETSHFFEQLRLDQMHLATIGGKGCLLRLIPMMNEAPGVRVTLDAMPLDQTNALPDDFTKPMGVVGTY
jgi:hypothetical protein